MQDVTVMRLNKSPYMLWRFIVVIATLNVLEYGIILIQYFLIHKVLIVGSEIRLFEACLVFIWLSRVAVLKERMNLSIPPSILVSYGAWVAYSIIVGFVQLCYGLSVGYSAYAFNVMMFYPLLFMAFSIQPLSYGVARKRWSLQDVTGLFYGFAVLTWPLGFAQFIWNRPLVPVSIANAKFQLTSVLELAKFHVRASSFFPSGLAYGEFSGMVVLIAMANLLYSKTYRVLHAGIFIVGVIAVYSTYTRSQYLSVIAMVAIFFGIRLLVTYDRPITNVIGTAMPFILGILSALVLFGGYQVLLTFRTSVPLFSTQTMVSRYIEWGNAFNAIGSEGLTKLILGSGLIQTSRLPNSLLVDNTPLLIIFYQGLLGAMFFFTVFGAIWTYMWHRYRQFGLVFDLVVLTKLAIFFIVGMVVDQQFGSIYDYLLVFVALFIIRPVDGEMQAKEKTEPREEQTDD